MEIKINKTGAGILLLIKAENAQIVEDIEQRTYFKSPDGKTDFSIPPFRDVSDETINQFVSTLDDLIYYRVKECDTSDLIERLFEKLPEGLKEKVAAKIIELTPSENDTDEQ